jgi:hypothetical protein
MDVDLAAEHLREANLSARRRRLVLTPDQYDAAVRLGFLVTDDVSVDIVIVEPDDGRPSCLDAMGVSGWGGDQ